MKTFLKRLAFRGAAWINRDAIALGRRAVRTSETSAMLAAKSLALQCRTLDSIASLEEVEFRVFSQFGEDGIVEWLVTRLPGIPERFIEFGVEDYEEANTRYLLINRNWRGLILDGSPDNIQTARNAALYWRHEVRAESAFIDAENIDGLIERYGYAGEIGVLSIDIDGNDYWVWQAIGCASPWIVIIEYNAVLGDVHPICIPYDPRFYRFTAHYSGLYAGASIAAHQHLAAEKGYVLLGSNSAGNNAFFVRADLAKNFDGVIQDRRARPSCFRESRSSDGSMSFTAGSKRADVLQDLPFVEVTSGRVAPLKSFGALESSHWTRT
jgi:hypothetical protein